MRGIITASLALAILAAAPPVRAAGPATAPAGAPPAVAAEISRLGADNEVERAAAVTALTRMGRPAAPALVAALGEARNDVRARAAEALRAMYAADPAGAPNYHDRAYWEKQVARLAVGMSVHDVTAILLPGATPEQRKEAVQLGVWSGQSGFSIVRVDDYWTVTLPLVDHGREKLGRPPTLKPSVRPVWVQPPADYTGTWVAWFVNGQKSHEIEYRNGKYHGRFTSFYDDGSKSYEQHTRDGVTHGTDTGWHRGGRKAYEGLYKDGKQDGVWQHWYPDGTPQSLCDYVDGKMSGRYVNWYENGQKRFEQNYLAGKQNGRDQYWDEQGTRLWDRTYHDGKLVAAE